jgi:hypothetical protein
LPLSLKIITFFTLSSLFTTGQVFCFAEKWSHWGPEECAKPPPAEAAQLTLQVLYILVQSFWKHQVSIKTKTPVRMTSSQRQTAAQEAASLLNEQTEATRALIGTTVALAVLLLSIVKTHCIVQSHAMEIYPVQKHMTCKRWKQLNGLYCCSD